MYQKLIFVGNLGRDPEMRFMQDGTAVTTLNVASSRRFTDRNGQNREETIWFRVSVWGKQAEVCNEYLQKGRQVLVEGRLRADENGNPRIWTRQDGTPGASFEVTAQTVRFLGSREAADFSAGVEGPPAPKEADDDIPF